MSDLQTEVIIGNVEYRFSAEGAVLRLDVSEQGQFSSFSEEGHATLLDDVSREEGIRQLRALAAVLEAFARGAEGTKQE